jgi:hypothetical protein
VFAGDASISPEYRSAYEHAQPIERHQCASESGWIYTVTTLAGGQAYGGTRTVAACSSFEKADELIRGNYGDIFEHSYQLAVIEAVPLDSLYGGSFESETYWYAWFGLASTGGYVPILTPTEYADAHGFGIG